MNKKTEIYLSIKQGKKSKKCYRVSFETPKTYQRLSHLFLEEKKVTQGTI